MSDQNNVEVGFGAKIDDLKSGVKEAQATVKEGVEQIKTHLEGFVGGLEKVTKAFAALTAIVAGGKMFKEAIDETRQITAESIKLGRALGITATEGSVMRVALSQVGADTDVANDAIGALTRTMRTTPENFEKLGVAVKDSNGQFRPMADILLDVTERFSKMADGTGKNIALSAIFGRQWQSVAPILKLTSESMEHAKEEAENLGLVVGQENVEAALKYRIAMNGMQEVMHGFQKVIGDAVMPILTELGEWFAQIGPTAITVIKTAIQALVGVYRGFVLGVQIGYEVIKGVFEAIAISAITMAHVAERAIRWDFKGAKAAWDVGAQQLQDTLTGHFDTIIKRAEETNAKIAAMLAPSTPTKLKEGSEAPDFTKDKNKDSLMQKLEAELAQQKIAFELRNNLREMDKQSEEAFWRSKLALADVGSKEYYAIQRKADEAMLAGFKKTQHDSQGLWKEDIDFREKLATDRLSIDEQEAQARFDRGEITTAQLLAVQLQFETRSRDMQKAFQEERLEMLANGPDDPVAMQAAKDKLLEIESAYQLKLKKIHEDQQKDEQKASINFGNSLQSDISTGFNTLLTKWQYLSDTLKGLFQSIYQSFAKTMIADPLAELAIAFVKQTAMWKAFSAWKISMFGVEQASSAIAKKAEAAATIPAEAAVAAGGAASAVAGIPIVGPELAAAAYAQTLAMVLGGLSLASSAGGDWQIPGDRLNMVHKNETILPADKSEGLDRLIQNGSSGGAMHITIHAVDAKSVERLFRENGTALAAAIGNQRRNFNGNLR